MKALLFDFGGTLDADGRTWIDRFYPIYKETGLEFPRERFDRAFYESDDGLPRRHALKGLSLEQTVRLQVEDVLRALAPDRRDAAPAVSGRFLEDCRAVFRRNAPVLDRLSRRFRLGVVSNFYGNLDSVLASEGLDRYFGAVADSGVVGRLKPDAGIFEHALRALGCGVQDGLMVGDSVPRDMRGAEGLRMRHALLGAGPACCAQAWRIRALPELEALL